MLLSYITVQLRNNVFSGVLMLEALDHKMKFEGISKKHKAYQEYI